MLKNYHYKKDRNTEHLKEIHKKYTVSDQEYDEIREELEITIEENTKFIGEVSEDFWNDEIGFLDEDKFIKPLKKAVTEIGIKNPTRIHCVIKGSKPIIKMINDVVCKTTKEIDLVFGVFVAYNTKSKLSNIITDGNSADKEVDAIMQTFDSDKEESIKVHQKYSIKNITIKEYLEILKYSIKIIEDDIATTNIKKHKISDCEDDKRKILKDQQTQLAVIEKMINNSVFLKKYIDKMLNNPEEHSWIIRVKLTIESDRIKAQRQEKRKQIAFEESKEAEKELRKLLASEKLKKIEKKSQEIEKYMDEGKFDKVDALSNTTYKTEDLDYLFTEEQLQEIKEHQKRKQEITQNIQEESKLN